MSEQLHSASPQDPTLLDPSFMSDNEKLSSRYSLETSFGPINVTATQESTRDDGTVELSGDTFSRDQIDFSGVKDHLSIHTGGQVAGSQFNGNLFPDSDTIVSFFSSVLPAELQFDQHGRVEMTLDVSLPTGDTLGYSGVKSIAELEASGVYAEKGIRTPGGIADEIDGIKGAWYPEMFRDESGSYVVKHTETGEVANPHGKFESEALIATVPNVESTATNRVSIVMQKNPETGQATVLTAYPGEIAPPFPTKINTETYQSDSLHSKEAEYWSTHAFIKFNGA